jgi:hypothetical protein
MAKRQLSMSCARGTAVRWTEPKVIARTSDNSDHPLLIANKERVFLSWMTRAHGYQFASLEDAP